MKALVWHGKRDVQVDNVPDPKIEFPTDAIVRITTTAICGSDLHLYEVLSPFLDEGDILGHEPMGVVEEVGSQVPNLKPGDRVVIPFNSPLGLDGPPPPARGRVGAGSPHTARIRGAIAPR
jgi:threonine dehydrogenase-like Zn-dependent dehydrogenase